MLQQVLSTLRQKQCNFPNCDTRTKASNQKVSRSLLGSQKQRTRVLLGYNYTWQHNAPLTMSCTMTTSHPSTSALPQLCHAPRLLVTRSHRLYFKLTVCRQYSSPGHMGSTSTASHVQVPQLLTRLVVDYFAYTARPGASARRAARRRLLRLHRAFGCLGTSRGTSQARRRPLCHVARLVADYFTSRRLVVDYFAHVARPGASACRAARRRLLRQRRTSGCHGTSRSTLQARHRLLYLRHASGCLGTSHSSSRGSSSTTSPTSRVRVSQHVTRLVVDNFAASHGSSSTTPPHAARRRLLRLRRASGCLGTSRGSSCGSLSTTLCPRLRLAATLAILQPRHASRLLVSRQHWLYFE
jgi:hypothetical protein